MTDTSATDLQTSSLGSFDFESVESISDLTMSYVTQGRLNAARDNAVLLLHGLFADHRQLDMWVGSDSIFDPELYFVILPDTLGAVTEGLGRSASPTRSGLGMRFPRFTMRDMVAAEHRLITKGLGLDSLLAVSGVSLGGLGALQWAVSYPDFMQAAIPVTPASRTSRSTALLMDAARRTIMLDPKWRNGDYPPDDPPRDGVMTGLLVQALFGASAQGFQERFDRDDEARAFYADQSRTLAAAADARDWIFRTWAADAHDVASSHEGSIERAARSIRTRLLVIVNRRDQLIPPHESGVIELIDAAADAKLVDFDNLGGHYAHRSRSGMALMATEIRDLLDRIARNAPGFSGPRFPRHWSRADLTPQGV